MLKFLLLDSSIYKPEQKVETQEISHPETVPGPLSRVGGTPMPHEVPAPSPVAFRQEPASDNLLDDDQWGSFSS